MSREERQARAKALANKPSRADRLFAIVKHLNPEAAAEYKKTGRWLCSFAPPWAPQGGAEPERNAPYVIRELDNGRAQIQVVGSAGDILAAVGESVEAALAGLEEKMR